MRDDGTTSLLKQVTRIIIKLMGMRKRRGYHSLTLNTPNAAASGLSRRRVVRMGLWHLMEALRVDTRRILTTIPASDAASFD